MGTFGGPVAETFAATLVLVRIAPRGLPVQLHPTFVRNLVVGLGRHFRTRGEMLRLVSLRSGTSEGDKCRKPA